VVGLLVVVVDDGTGFLGGVSKRARMHAAIWSI
jgi:hypothetical protein